MNELIKSLRPETKLEKSIISDPEFIVGAYYGRPRSGHLEGEVYKHILEVLNNVDDISTNYIEREKLRFITLIHDTFKYKVNHTKPRVGENHHGKLAYNFAKKYINDKSILQIILLHDEVYHIWRKANKEEKWFWAEKKLLELINNIENLNLYTKFFECDNNTKSKTRNPLLWYLDILKKHDVIS